MKFGSSAGAGFALRAAALDIYRDGEEHCLAALSGKLFTKNKDLELVLTIARETLIADGVGNKINRGPCHEAFQIMCLLYVQTLALGHARLSPPLLILDK